MSNKTRYKVGDEFKATLVITEWDEDEVDPLYTLTVKELEDSELADSYRPTDLDMAFNRAFIKRKLQADIDKATKLLEEMGNE